MSTCRDRGGARGHRRRVKATDHICAAIWAPGRDARTLVRRRPSSHLYRYPMEMWYTWVWNSQPGLQAERTSPKGEKKRGRVLGGGCAGDESQHTACRD